MEKRKQVNYQLYPEANREYKSTLFCMAFKDRKDLLELYNAVNNTNYQNVDDLEVNTLEDVVYISVKNDVSFLIGETMNLYEHQSTYNPNMPIRGLIYFARLYDAYVESNGINLYSSALKKLPLPRYIVFYNGTEREPDEVVLSLADAFEKRGDGQTPCLECIATMLNINYGHNRELMEKCRRLEEYSDFVRTVRRHTEEMKSLSESITQAVDECIERNVLKDILVKNRAEVIGMILSAVDQEKYEKMMQEEWKTMGLEAGREEGRELGREEGREEGRVLGREEGERLKLINLVCRKLKKGKSWKAIAEELEENLETISVICNEAEKLAPDYDIEKLYELLYKQDS